MNKNCYNENRKNIFFTFGYNNLTPKLFWAKEAEGRLGAPQNKII